MSQVDQPMSNEADAACVRDVFNYCPETGALTWRLSRGKGRAGASVGTPDACGYIRVMALGKFHSAHRICWLHYYARWPEKQIDHINGIRDDNRIANLREATSSQQQMNRLVQDRGVYWNKGSQKWQVSVKVDRKLHHFGLFEDKNQALAVAAEAIKEFYGEFARQ